MKRINVWMVALMALLLGLTSCSQERDVNPSNGVALEVSTSIDNLTRVTGTNAWSAGDAIGVFVGNLGSNVEYKAASAGTSTNFTSTTGVTIPGDGSKYDVLAYYPYKSGVTDTYEFDIAALAGQPVLYAKSAGQVDYANNEIALGFEHKLGRLNITIDATPIGGTANQAVTAISIADVNTKNTLTIATGALGTASTPATLNLISEGSTTYYTYLMPGQDLTGKKITLTYNGKDYAATFTSGSIVAGKYNSYTIALNADAPSLVIGGGTTIGAVTENESGDLVATPEAGTTPTPTVPSLSSTAQEFDAASNTLSAATAGGSYVLTLNSDATTLEHSSTANWVTLDGSTLRAADKTITVKVAANETTEAREAAITLYDGDATEALITFTVTQEGKQEAPAPVITLATNPLKISEAEYTGTVAVTLENATEFTVTNDDNASWILADASADFKSIELVADANNGAERTANIVVKAGETSVTLVVTQAAKEVTPAPTNNWLFPDNKLTGYVSEQTVSGVTGSIEATSGKSGGEALRLSGKSTKNDYNVEFTAPSTLQGKPKSITFWIKGISTGRSISFVHKSSTSSGFNLGVLDSAKTITYAGISYTGSITANDWVQVTLDYSAFGENILSANSELFWIKTGKPGEYDILLSDFEIHY